MRRLHNRGRLSSRSRLHRVITVLRFIRVRFRRSHCEKCAEQTQRPRAAVRLQMRGVREEVLLGVQRGRRAAVERARRRSRGGAASSAPTSSSPILIPRASPESGAGGSASCRARRASHRRHARARCAATRRIDGGGMSRSSVLVVLVVVGFADRSSIRTSLDDGEGGVGAVRPAPPPNAAAEMMSLPRSSSARGARRATSPAAGGDRLNRRPS